jgi:hypothetical protein
MPGRIYDLISCGGQADILGLTHPVQHPYDGQIVYVTGGSSSRLYTLTFRNLVDASVGGTIPNLTLTGYTSCSASEHFYTVESCKDGTIRTLQFSTAPTFGQVVKFQNECDSYTVIARAANALSVAPTVESTHTSCLASAATVAATLCDIAEVNISFADLIKLPVPPALDRGFGSCCKELVVLADPSDSDEYKNDYTSVHYYKQIASDSVEFKLKRLSDASEYALNSSTYGEYQSGTLSYYKVEWQKVLNLLGADRYVIIKEITIAGQTQIIQSITYNLQAFSATVADRTVKIESVTSGEIKRTGAKFDNYKTSIRVPGFFGRSEPNYTQDNIIYSNYQSKQVSISIDNEYTFQSNLLPDCVTEEILYFMLLANDIFITDYNLNNHSYELKKVPVLLRDNAGTEYYTRAREAQLNLTFEDRFKDLLKTNCN